MSWRRYMRGWGGKHGRTSPQLTIAVHGGAYPSVALFVPGTIAEPLGLRFGTPAALAIGEGEDEGWLALRPTDDDNGVAPIRDKRSDRIKFSLRPSAIGLSREARPALHPSWRTEDGVLYVLLPWPVDDADDLPLRSAPADVERPSKLTAPPIAEPTGHKKPTPAPRKSTPKPDSASPARRDARVEDGVRISASKGGVQQWVVAFSLSPQIVDQMGLAMGSEIAAPTFDGSGRIILRPAGKGERSYRLRPYGTTTRALVRFPWSLFGVTAPHDPVSAVYAIQLDGTLAVTPPSWFGQEKTKRAEVMDAKPSASARVEPRVPLGTELDLSCAACGEHATIECPRCHAVICTACWPAHTAGHRRPSAAAGRTESQAARP